MNPKTTPAIRKRISQIELGRGEGAPLSLWIAIGQALDQPLAVSFTRPFGETRQPADAGHLARTLQAALDDWERVAPQLELLATDLEHEVIQPYRPEQRLHRWLWPLLRFGSPIPVVLRDQFDLDPVEIVKFDSAVR